MLGNMLRGCHSRVIYLTTKMKLSSKRQGYKGRRSSSLETSSNSGEESSLPKFATLMRSVYKRCHPDLMRARFPEAALVNEKGLQTINSVLDTIKKFNSFPPQIIQSIPLALLSQDGNDLLHVTLRIKTAGGDCKRSLTLSFADLFIQAGLIKEDTIVDDKALSAKKKGKRAKKQPDLFVWNAGFFVTEGEEEE